MLTWARRTLPIWVAFCFGSDIGNAAVEAFQELEDDTCLLQQSTINSFSRNSVQPRLEQGISQAVAVDAWQRRSPAFRYGFMNGAALEISQLVSATDASAKPNKSESRTVISKGGAVGTNDTNETGETIVIVTNQTQSGTANETAINIKGNSSSVASEETPFANVTVNTTVQVVNESTPGKATTNNSEQTVVITEKVIILATLSEIFYTHLAGFMPLAILWCIYIYLGRNPQLYAVLLPITFCVFSVTERFTNQTLVLATTSPGAVTLIQSLFMMLMAGTWTLFLDQDTIQQEGAWQYIVWIWVALAFTIQEVMSRVTPLQSSLSERTAINNLSPVVTLILESIIMPQAFKPIHNVNVTFSLLLLVVGAVLFSLSPSESDFTQNGIPIVLIWVFAVVLCKVTQRHYLCKFRFASLAFLVFIDGLVCTFFSLLVTDFSPEHFLVHLGFWLSSPSIDPMLLLSCLTSTGKHVCGLALLQLFSATSTLVFQSISGFVEVTLGILFFGDQDFSTPLSCIGLGTSLASGLWYSTEVVRQQGDCERQKETG